MTTRELSSYAFNVYGGDAKLYNGIHDLETALMTNEQIENTFSYHKPFGSQPMRYEAIRAEAKVLAKAIQEACPESREKSLALTNLQQAVMWANAAIALNECDVPT